MERPMSGEEFKLSDEQVDLLNTDFTVKAARSKYLQALSEHMKDPTSETLVALSNADAEYGTVFAEQLRDVVENPPTPKSLPLINRRGFK
jgi:hypothetical protein